MRTKTLLLTAAFVAAGVATSMAQVYSQNVVGYVNKSIPLKTGAALTYAILANPLNGTNNNINTVIPTAPEGSQLFKFSGGLFESPETFITGAGWIPGTAELLPGEGFFIAVDNAVAANPTTLTFVGEVPQGNLSTPVPNGYSIKASPVPQEGGVTGVLGLTPASESQIFTWNIADQRYNDPFTYIDGAGWIPSDPVIPVGEGFFLLNPGGAFNWTRNFTVQ